MLTRTRIAHGFTVIEVLITLAILGVLLTLGMPWLGAWMQNTQIRTAAESIKNGLQFARGEAVRLNTDVSFSMTGPDTGWAVTQVSTAQVLQSRAGMEGSPNAVIAPASLPVAITFNGLGQTSLGSTATIEVTNPTGGACSDTFDAMRCLNIAVSVGGQVKMCDPTVTTAGDSRKC